MDKRIWRIITRCILSVNRSFPPSGRTPTFSDVLILRMYLWCVWHDRPMYWVCQRQSLGQLFRPRALPSRSQFCRRIKTKRFKLLLEELTDRLSRQDIPSRYVFMDGKALPVSESTRDPEATTGRGNGRFSRGYKLHAVGAEDGRITAFCVRPLNEHEVPVTQENLVKHVPSGARVMADGNYDSDQLYRQLQQQGCTLFTPLKGRAKSSHRLSKMSSARRKVLRMWQERQDLCLKAYKRRKHIERIFSAITCVAGGLAPLPNWVRRLERVTRWVTAKIIVYNARVLARRTA